MITKPKSFSIKAALTVLFSFCAFQVLRLQLPLLLYEQGSGLSALALCAEAMFPPDLYNVILLGALTAFCCKAPNLQLKTWEYGFCICFSLFLMIGDSFAAIDSWDLVWGTPAALLLSDKLW